MQPDISMFWNVYETPFGVGAFAASKKGISSIVLPNNHWTKKWIPPFANFDKASWFFDRSLKGRRELEKYYQDSGSKRLNQDTARKLLDLDTVYSGKSDFQVAILEACLKLEAGDVASYGELAEMAGYSGSARAVGSVMATNSVPLLIPCHRVVRADYTVGQYGGGSEMKTRLLEIEGALAPA